MFFALGVLGILFAGWAPGYAAARLLRISDRLPVFAGPFALSLILNNLLVEILVAAGLYTQAVLVPLALFSVLASIVMLLRDERMTFGRLESGFQSAHATMLKSLGPKWSTPALVSALLVLASLLLVMALIFAIRDFGGSEILGYDPIVSWNRWALDWAHNQFPHMIWHYPQLLPALWSICYVVTGNTHIEYFSSSFLAIFWIASFECLALLSLRRRDWLLLLAIPFLYFCFVVWIGGTSQEDYADVPVAFMALIAGVTVLANDADDRKANWSAFALASGAAMTKQVGLYMFAGVPILLLAVKWEDRASLGSLGRKAASLLPPLLLAAMAAAPMYIYSIVTIRSGTNVSELPVVLGGLLDDSYWRRFQNAFEMLYQPPPINRAISLLIVFGGAISLREKNLRWTFLLVALPFTLLWTEFFSYDGRNLALAMPYWALSGAAGLSCLFRNPFGWLEKLGRKSMLILCNVYRELTARRWIRRYGIASLFLMLVAFWTGTKALHMPYPAFEKRQADLDRTVYGGVCYDRLGAILKSFGPKHLTLSEWRWACLFRFNNTPGVCQRIYPDQFDFSPASMSRYQDFDLLLILPKPALTPRLQTQLKSDKMRIDADLHCDQDSRFYIRRRNGS